LVTLKHAHQKLDDKQSFQKGVVTKKKGNMLNINGLNKGKKLKQVIPWHAKLLKDGSSINGVEIIYTIHLH
jgi:hypothetical protein